MKIIFLDIDGVLNNHASLSEGIHISNDKCKLVKHIVEKTDAKIVLSSTWRAGDLLTNIERMLYVCGGPYKAFVGATPIINEIEGRRAIRGDEIDKWLKDTHYNIEKYVILDDDSDFHEHQKPFFIQTSMSAGLLTRQAELAVDLLKGRVIQEKSNEGRYVTIPIIKVDDEIDCAIDESFKLSELKSRVVYENNRIHKKNNP